MALVLFIILVLIISAVFHEYAHGWVAHKLGDDTAKAAGRLTLNPLAHLDPIGSVILPLLLVFSHSAFFIAWAKPVPYNPFNLRDRKYGDLKVALAGPLTNFIIAIIFGLLARFIPLAYMLKQSLAVAFISGNYDALLNQVQGSFAASVFVLSLVIVLINLLLMIFNLIPLPPLDGSKVLLTFLPADWKIRFYKIEPYGIFIILLLFLWLYSLIWTPLLFLFSLLTGVA